VIEKYWSDTSPNYDKQFDRITDNMWSVWKTECNEIGEHVIDKPRFIKRFGYEPIENIHSPFAWQGLFFEDVAAYVLFMMEWS